MSVELDEKAIVKLSPGDVVMARLNKYMDLTVDGLTDKEGLLAVKAARKDARTARMTIESERKQLKAGALDYGRRVDAAAKKATAPIKAIEEHLVEQESIVKRERERKEKEASEKRAADLKARLDALAAVGVVSNPLSIEEMEEEDFAEYLASQTSAFEFKQEAEARERERLDAEKAEFERKKLELEQQLAEANERERVAREAEEKRLAEIREAEEKVRLEANRQEAERLKIEADKQRLIDEKELEAKRAQMEVEARERADAEAQEKIRLAEEKRIADALQREKEAALRKREEAMAAEAETARVKAEQLAEEKRLAEIEKMRPDAEKLKLYADSLRKTEVPGLATEEANALALNFLDKLTKLTKPLYDFGD